MRLALLLLVAALVAWLLRPRREPVPAAYPLRDIDSDDGIQPPFSPTWVPAPGPNTNNAPWYVASCGYAHPWGICHGHVYTFTGESS